MFSPSFASHVAFLAGSARQWRNVDAANARKAGDKETAARCLAMAREYENKLRAIAARLETR